MAVAGSDDPPDLSPGDVLMEWLKREDHSQTWLALELGISLKHVNRIIHGQAGFSPELAIKFAVITGIPARRWMQVQADYILFRALERQRPRIRRRPAKRQPS